MLRGEVENRNDWSAGDADDAIQVALLDGDLAGEGGLDLHCDALITFASDHRRNEVGYANGVLNDTEAGAFERICEKALHVSAKALRAELRQLI